MTVRSQGSIQVRVGLGESESMAERDCGLSGFVVAGVAFGPPLLFGRGFSQGRLILLPAEERGRIKKPGAAVQQGRICDYSGGCFHGSRRWNELERGEMERGSMIGGVGKNLEWCDGEGAMKGSTSSSVAPIDWPGAERGIMAIRGKLVGPR